MGRSAHGIRGIPPVQFDGPPLRLLHLLVLAGVAFVLAAASPQRVESTHLKMIVGLTDDTGKWMDRQEGIVKFHRDLGLMAVRVTVPWKPGQVKPNKLQGTYLHRIARMIQLNDRIVLSVYNTSRFAPTTAKTRVQYCSFLQGVLRRIPLIRDVEIWNEANSPTYWPQDNGGETYTALLAHCYDVLHQQVPACERDQLDSVAPRSSRLHLLARRCVSARADGRVRSSTRSATTRTPRIPPSRRGRRIPTRT